MKGWGDSRSIMSYGPILLVVSLFLTATPMTAWAAHLGAIANQHPGGGRLAEDTKNTLHNLSSSSLNTNNIDPVSSGTTEVCVYCHTPHGGQPDPTVTGGAPLWNRAIDTTAGYTMYSAAGTGTFEGEDEQPAPWGISLACLSCHDGTIALDALINAPGSGGLIPSNLTTTGGAVSIGIVAGAGGSSLIDAFPDSSMDDDTRTDSGANYDTILTGAAPFPNLTTNLSDDHPISMKIPHTACNTLVGPEDPQFNDVCTNSPAITASGLTYLTRSAASTVNADLRDRIRAYPSPSDPSPSGGAYIECASCHNPHAPRPVFLRLPSPGGVNLKLTAIESGGDTTTVANVIGNSDLTLIADDPNAGSLVCLSCHEK